MNWPFSRAKNLPSGDALYAAVVAEARRPGWYIEAEVPDTMDGRFAVLASLLALADIRLGRGGEDAARLAARLAECFIADMDAQMRQAGFGDPGLGKQVRMMVGSLASRVDRWAGAIEQAERGEAWREAAAASLYKDEPPAEEALAAGEARLADWWRRIETAPDAALAEGKIGALGKTGTEGEFA